MVNRIKKLNEDIQEYINIGIKIGLFNETNLERIISRLERVEFSIDNSIPGDAQTVPIRDNNNPRISYGIDIKINKRKTLSSDKLLLLLKRLYECSKFLLNSGKNDFNERVDNFKAPSDDDLINIINEKISKNMGGITININEFKE